MKLSCQQKEDLLRYNALGIFPSVDEEIEPFLKRAWFLSQNEGKLSFEVRKELNVLYDIDPIWIQVNYANKGLSFFEAGCTWIGENIQDPPQVQLKKIFKKKERFLWLYTKKEILAHECIHAVRRPLASIRFEEIFAYMTSSAYSMRSILGPIFRSSREVIALFLLLGCFFISLLCTSLFFLMIVLFFLSLFFFLCRLSYDRITLSKCTHFLEQCMKKQAVFFFMFRLSDDEIATIARMKNKETFFSWKQEKKKESFRWQLFDAIYF